MEVIDSIKFFVLLQGYDLYKHFDRILTKQLTILIHDCMPCNIKATHALAGSANGVMSLVMPVLKAIISKALRLRMVFHLGSDAAVLESIKSYGLSSQNLSHVIAGGDFKHDDFLAWLEERKEEEAKR
jgi:hypothetical protein